jgi:hypothetical protein
MRDSTTAKRSCRRTIGGCAGAITALAVLFPSARPARATDVTSTPKVAVVGGSLTRQPANAAGHLETQGHFTHDYPSEFNGGTVVMWADPVDPRWVAFDEWLADHPHATHVWWEILFHQTDFVELGYAGLQAAARTVYANLKSHLDGRDVYLSPMFGYLPGSRCKISDAAVAAAQQIVAVLLADYPALRTGPVFDPVPPDQVKPKSCHTNDIGDDVQGAVLNAFFDAALG